jgi:hypothetical protein
MRKDHKLLIFSSVLLVLGAIAFLSSDSSNSNEMSELLKQHTSEKKISKNIIKSYKSK